MSVASSSRLLGIAMPCPSKHEYCMDCMTSYIRIKLDGATGDGQGVFPIHCPECEWELDDSLADKVLGRDLLDVWHFQRLLAETSKVIHALSIPQIS